MNPELAALFKEDQKDRANWQAGAQDLQAMAERDRLRRERAKRLIAEGALTTAEDYFHAAMLLQHGDSPDDFRRAHELALRAVELGHPEEKRARWLAAASLDRWLTARGKPQKYGTQFFKDSQGWRLMPYDPETTDEERAAWGVPPLAETLRRLEELRRQDPWPRPGCRNLANETQNAPTVFDRLKVRSVLLSGREHAQAGLRRRRCDTGEDHSLAQPRAEPVNLRSRMACGPNRGHYLRDVVAVRASTYH